MLAYIAAFIDGEGHIGTHPLRSGYTSKCITFCNTDKSLIDAMVNFLHATGFPTRVHYDAPPKNGWSPKWVVDVAGGEKSFRRFDRLVPLQSEKKKQALRNIILAYDTRDEARALNKQKRSTPCEVCGAPVLAAPATRKRGGGRFCSVTCRGLHGRKRVEKACATCGALFEVVPSQTDARFCSLTCFGKSKSDMLRTLAKKGAAARWGREE